MASRRRWRVLLLAGFVVGLLSASGSVAAQDHATIHHAGVLRSVDAKAGVLVVDERVRLGPPLLTRIHVDAATTLVRVRRAGGEFRGERVPLDQLGVGEYLVVRGVDEGDRHHAEMIWSLGPAD